MSLVPSQSIGFLTSLKKDKTRRLIIGVTSLNPTPSLPLWPRSPFCCSCFIYIRLKGRENCFFKEFFFVGGKQKVSDYEVTPNPRVAQKLFKNPDFKAIYHFLIDSYHTSANDRFIPWQTSFIMLKFQQNRTKPEEIRFFCYLVQSLEQTQELRSPTATEKHEHKHEAAFSTAYCILRNETRWINLNWNEHIQCHNSRFPSCDYL